MYQMINSRMFDYGSIVNYKAVDKKYNPVTHKVTTYSSYIIMVDTETSKTHSDTFKWVKQGKKQIKKYDDNPNYVVAFTISIRDSHTHENIVTLYGSDPEECAKCMHTLTNVIVGDKVLMFIFNAPYDWVFLRKFLFRYFGTPDNQLNISSHYPINIDFGKLVIRDALILAQRKLEKWALDLNVEHQKAVGNWDYKHIRQQGGVFSDQEKEYIEHDTLAGVECIDKVLMTLGCKLKDIPFTATGIARRQTYKIGRKNKAKCYYNNIVMTQEQYYKAVAAFHGGYTHNNRYTAGKIFKDVVCYDETSAYPFCACAKKFPITKFIELPGYYTVDDILSTHDKYAYIFKVTFINVEIKNNIQMPVMQAAKDISKCSYNEMFLDNGRVLKTPIYCAYMTDVDLQLIVSQYDAEYTIINEVMRSEYGYLPRWFTDHVYKLYEDKCKLKGGDPVLYDITKAQLNSVAYGMLAMRNIKELIIEDYLTGEYTEQCGNDDELYNKFVNNRKNIYPYQWSCWVTSWAQFHLHELGACCDLWLYSDTDSCFSNSWHEDKIKAYNQRREDELRANGYKPIEVNGKYFYLGRACVDKVCNEFKALHSKCYCYTDKDGLHITIAGVPKKKGAQALKSINDFNDHFIFRGEDTGKLTHIYYTVPKIYRKNNILYGDSIDLVPCDYEINPVRINYLDDLTILDSYIDNIFTKSVYSSCRDYE